VGLRGRVVCGDRAGLSSMGLAGLSGSCIGRDLSSLWIAGLVGLKGTGPADIMQAYIVQSW
jgi:hypothetical protein